MRAVVVGFGTAKLLILLGRTGESNLERPLWKQTGLPGGSLQRHPGRYLEELALFALPRPAADDEADSNVSNANFSNASAATDYDNDDERGLSLIHGGSLYRDLSEFATFSTYVPP